MNNLQCRKAYVRVNLDVDEEGTIIPMLIRWKDGRVFHTNSSGSSGRSKSTSSRRSHKARKTSCTMLETCKEKGFNIISSMGMGNKLDPTKIEVTDIHKTHTCPLAKVIRKELKDRRIKKLKVVYSTEQPIELKHKIMNGKKVTPGSISFVPSVGGLIIASVVINDLIK